MAGDSFDSESGAKVQTNAFGICPTCHHALTQLGPDGECLRCVMSWAFAPDQDVATSLRYGHFEVELDDDGPVVLGAGAMAITYRARDTVLNSVVALKVIGRKLADNPMARSRFLREARAAAQIHHPNVARVIHYGEQDGECFYAMELVEGETLEARVQRTGPMPVSQALEVIEQATRALAAAETCGVVHRDIKPSNVMIESDPSGALLVKIIDYGVAKVLAAQTDPREQTQIGFIGTPAFASPEQFGEPGDATVDARSDIYSLGATLWYLLTGRTPISGKTPGEIRASHSKLPVEQLKAARVPAAIVELLKRMLAPDPAKRPQSASELLEGVHRAYLRFEPRATLRRKRVALIAAAVGLTIAAAGVAFFFYQRAQSAAQEERSIAVLPFENLSGKDEDTYFTLGMQEEIAGNVAKIAGIRVIGSQSARSYAPGKGRDLPAIARDLGARHLLEGTVTRDGDQMRVALRLVDSRNPAHAWTEAYVRPLGDVFSLQSEITRAIAAKLQSRLTAGEKALLDAPPTADLRAYDLYLQARALLSFAGHPSLQELLANSKRAIPMLEQAVTRDSNFVAAYCELAKWHDAIHFDREHFPAEEQAIDHRSLAEEALEKARRVQPDSGAVHLALARHALQINHNVEEGGIQIQLAQKTLFNNAELETMAGRVARRQDRWDEAVQYMERAVSLEPRDRLLRYLLASTYTYMRRLPEADRMVESMLALAPQNEYSDLAITRALIQFEYTGEIAPLQQVIATESTKDAEIAGSKLDTRMFEAIWSRNPDALARFASEKKGPIWWNNMIFPDAWLQALAARLSGNDPAAREAFAAARTQMEQNVQREPTRGVPLGFLAIVDAGLGQAEQALEEAKRACDLSSFQKNNIEAVTARYCMAVVYAWTGHNDLAMAELSKLVDRPSGGNEGAILPSYGDFRRNPFWDPLRKDPAFEALVQRLAPKL
jgi:TolB-like protein/tRNA A-37 threonylcarbamoyl transferase component Bud32